MTHDEAWVRFVNTLSKTDANGVAAELVSMKARRSAQVNCEMAEYVIFISSSGREVLPMPCATNVGF